MCPAVRSFDHSSFHPGSLPGGPFEQNRMRLRKDLSLLLYKGLTLLHGLRLGLVGVWNPTPDKSREGNLPGTSWKVLPFSEGEPT